MNVCKCLVSSWHGSTLNSQRALSPLGRLAVGSLGVRASDSRPEGLGSMPDATKHLSECTRSTCSLNQWVRSLVGLNHERRDWRIFPLPLQFTCRNCGGGDRGRVALYRPFGELLRAKIVLSPVWCSRLTTGVPLAHATMNFVGLDLTTSDRWHQKTRRFAICFKLPFYRRRSAYHYFRI
ncbi:hypothetical protein TNCV_2359381 [Trichonephila clavipes]|nr:hypothetical protein TNCV_2359381 [Trichonephila clavipes]